MTCYLKGLLNQDTGIGIFLGFIGHAHSSK